MYVQGQVGLYEERNEINTGPLCVSLNVQMQFYGLKFRTGLNHYRWLDREKPVREQLKRHADRSYADLLYFCVQYYVHDINLLPDDASR